MNRSLIVSLFVFVAGCFSSLTIAEASSQFQDEFMHPHFNFWAKLRSLQKPVEDAEFWRQDAQRVLQDKIKINNNIEARAKNVIFFLGDGMSVPTITAARILKGQKVDKLPFGEEGELYMDTFPNIGVSKTFCSDSQVADSACSATAYLCGTKANIATIGVTPAVMEYDCIGHANPENHVSSILAWAQAAGKSTGVVTTTRITHASPSGTYAHTASRDWESDADVINKGDGDDDPKICIDIATQLIKESPGKNITVILGGGRRKFLPKTEKDPEDSTPGEREDGINLIEEYKNGKAGQKFAYVELKDDLLAVDTKEIDYLLGLFGPSDIGYLDEQESLNDPSLEDMTRVAIEILSKNPNGFFLFVEGGRIDHAHHGNQVQRALWETIELDKAIQRGDNMTDDQDTLIVITADHAHVMSIAGYPIRGNPLEGIAEYSDKDFLPYGTLGYANGPGYREYIDGKRPDITNDDFLTNVKYRTPVAVPIGSETHGGDDVLILSKGPYSHYLTGVQQQSYIPHALAYAACIGSGAHAPECSSSSATPSTSTGSASIVSSSLVIVNFVLITAIHMILFTSY